MAFPFAQLDVRWSAGAGTPGDRASNGAAPPKSASGNVPHHVHLPIIKERYTSTTDNPRLFPRIRRDSKEWRKHYALRTSVERCIKRQKVDYKLETSQGRSSRHWNIRVSTLTPGSKKQRNKKSCLPFSNGLTNLLPRNHFHIRAMIHFSRSFPLVRTQIRQFNPSSYVHNDISIYLNP